MRRGPQYSAQTKAQALVLYSTGMSYTDIARLLNAYDASTVRYWINPKAKKKKAAYAALNREKLVKYSAEYYRKNTEQYVDWYEENREKVLKDKAAHRKANSERYKKREEAYRKKYPEKNRNKTARYRTKKVKATPPWFTKEHDKQCLSLQTRAVELERETGVKHHVDHIYPITGKTRLNGRYQHTSCGLHVPWNLKVLPGPENSKKSFKIPDPAVDPPTAW